MNKIIFRFFLIFLTFSLSFTSTTTHSQVEEVFIFGSVSYSLDPLFNLWSQDFYSVTNALITVNYSSNINDKVIADIKTFSTNFAGLDVPLSSQDKSEITGTVLTIPISLNAISVVYNIPNMTSPLLLDGDTLGRIFQGNITVWNDPAIMNLNPDNADSLLPNDIVVARRSDDSSTTLYFSRFLSEFAPWVLGYNSSIDWPANTTGGSGNSGVSIIVSNNDYSIGYVDYSYNYIAKIDTAQIDALGGFPSEPNSFTISNAAQDIAFALPSGAGVWDNFYIPPNASDSYPISFFHYLTVYQAIDTGPTTMGSRGPAFIAWLNYILSDNTQLNAESLGYIALPTSILIRCRGTVGSILYDPIYDPNDYWLNTETIPITSKTSFPTFPVSSSITTSSSADQSTSDPFSPQNDHAFQDFLFIIGSIGIGSGTGLLLAFIFRKYR